MTTHEIEHGRSVLADLKAGGVVIVRDEGDGHALTCVGGRWYMGRRLPAEEVRELRARRYLSPVVPHAPNVLTLTEAGFSFLDRPL